MEFLIGSAPHREDLDLRGAFGRHSLDDLFNESGAAPIRRSAVETLAPSEGLWARIQRRRRLLPLS